MTAAPSCLDSCPPVNEPSFLALSVAGQGAEADGEGAWCSRVEAGLAAAPPDAAAYAR